MESYDHMGEFMVAAMAMAIMICLAGAAYALGSPVISALLLAWAGIMMLFELLRQIVAYVVGSWIRKRGDGNEDAHDSD